MICLAKLDRNSFPKMSGFTLALAEELGQRYDTGVTHLEMGRRLSQRAHLERAEAILSEIDAGWALARVQEAMKVIS